MSARYADIIIDISHESVDKPFSYRIPEELKNKIDVGSVVKVPFGRWNKERLGYVISFSDTVSFDESLVKDITGVAEQSLSVEAKLIKLAAWIRSHYGCTMITALKTVMPVKEKVRETKGKVDVREHLPEFRPVDELEQQQLEVLETFTEDLDAGRNETYLLHGVTGSGKTEIYIRMAEEVIARGKDVIVLVPEIALTYQTVARFSSYFQDSIAILNSRLSKGEKYREFLKVREGGTHIMIGPRSALFAPFPNLGLIIIDEEHDTAYKSDQTPKYHAREVAIERGHLEGASVVLGSATPAISSFYKAEEGEYKLLSLTDRATGAALPEVSVVDLREELRLGNRSIISKELYERLRTAFDNKEQAMLFINRRGFNSCVSCRECGEVVKCPNCDVSLSLHANGTLMCHYCGFIMPMVKECPKCQSKLIGGFGTGTEKLEQEVHKLFPDIKTIRMDKDTTQRKGAHGAIIKNFREGKSDCLIGTQMIVKGHDFPKVTVVGNVLADLSLFDSDYESAERTFDLLTQAAGRAGRAELPGYVIFQTYQPEHYAISTAARQDYAEFYKYEMGYRKALHFPPVSQLLGILISSGDEDVLDKVSAKLGAELKAYMKSGGAAEKDKTFDIIGPAEARVGKINNLYRRVIYIKSEFYELLTDFAEKADEIIRCETEDSGVVEAQYDFNPMSML